MSSPKSAARATKDEEHSEETPKTNLKRKRTPAKENVNIPLPSNYIICTKDAFDMRNFKKKKKLFSRYGFYVGSWQ